MNHIQICYPLIQPRFCLILIRFDDISKRVFDVGSISEKLYTRDYLDSTGISA